MTTVAVLGAGLQGCAIALELSARGCVAELFDREPAPMRRASRWNEGKIHLGFVYAMDTSLRTAERMLDGAFDFADFFTRHLGHDALGEPSSAFHYAVPNESALNVDQVATHLSRVDDLIAERQLGGRTYLGAGRLPRCERIDPAPHFDPSRVQAVFATPERSVGVARLAALVAERVAADSAITFHGEHGVRSIERTASGVVFTDERGDRHGPFDQLVNCTWEHRIALDATLGIRAQRPWLHRYKLAVHTDGLAPLDTPSTTMVLGPFGDFVNLAPGRYYLSWYPTGRLASTPAMLPGDPEAELGDDDRRAIAATIHQRLSEFMPELRRLGLDDGAVDVRGGHIVAWGATDIDDPGSELHRRSDIGVFSHGRYHSVDTGKYCTASVNARNCADIVLGSR